METIFLKILIALQLALYCPLSFGQINLGDTGGEMELQLQQIQRISKETYLAQNTVLQRHTPEQVYGLSINETSKEIKRNITMAYTDTDPRKTGTQGLSGLKGLNRQNQNPEQWDGLTDEQRMLLQIGREGIEKNKRGYLGQNTAAPAFTNSTEAISNFGTDIQDWGSSKYDRTAPISAESMAEDRDRGTAGCTIVGTIGVILLVYTVLLILKKRRKG